MNTAANTPERLRELVKSRGITQKELARLSGLSTGAVNNYLSGKRLPGLEECERLANALQVSPAVLVGWESEKPTEAR